MGISELGIKRHVMAYMIGFVIILFGCIGLYRVGIDEMPAVNFPVVVIHTTLVGADASIIDRTVTSILLDNLNGIEGIDTIEGRSLPSVSIIQIVFDLEKDINLAFSEVQAKLSQVSGLPTNAKAPIVYKASSNDNSILEFTISGNRNIQQLTDFAENIVKKQIENVSGVSQVNIYGNRDREIKIILDNNKLAMYGISPKDITSKLSLNHIQAPGGYLVGNKQEFLLNLDFEYHNVEDLKKLVIKASNNSLIRLSDIADVYEGLSDFRSYSSYNGETSVNLGITSVVGSNSFDIKKEIMERIEDNILPGLEPGMKLNLTNDTVEYIKVMVDNLKEHIYLGVFLTGLIVFVFLRNIIPTIIIGISIPISLLASCLVIYLCGYTLNSITLLGLLLLIGIVVDDAIIVLENIYRYLEEGVDSLQASIDGSKQVAFSVLAATLSLVCIFGSVMFLEGILGKFFKSFAVVVTCGVLISYFVSLYITPMLCSRYLKINKKENLFKRILNNSLNVLEKIYAKSLYYALNHRIIVVILSLLCLFSITKANITTGFLPDSDRSLIKMSITAPQGTNVYDMMDKAQEVEKAVKQYKEIISVSTLIGSSNSSGSANTATINLGLVPINERTLNQGQIVEKLKEAIKNISGVKIYISGQASAGGDGYGITFYLKSLNLDELTKYSDILARAISSHPYLGGVPRQSVDLLPQISFYIDRDKMALLGINVEDVRSAITSSITGVTVAEYNNVGGSIRYDVRLQGSSEEFKNIDDLSNIYIITSQGEHIKLDSIIKYDYTLGYSTIYRSGSMYSNKFNLNPNLPPQEAVDEINKIIQEKLPSSLSIEYGGTAKQLKKATSGLASVFILAIVLLYMVLASQFNSFLQPLVLMVPIPLAVVGAVWGLVLMDVNLNIFSTIGIVLLVGLVAKNSILLIDFTNQLRAEGLSIREALEKACPIRLRPILITSLTVILTMIPAALSSGEGAEINKSLAVAIVGGMISSTMLTLFIIPSVYSLVENLKEKITRKFKRSI